MDLQSVIEMKKALELDITEAVGDLVVMFSERAGVSPTGIRIRMLDISTMENENPIYMVSSTEVEIKI